MDDFVRVALSILGMLLVADLQGREAQETADSRAVSVTAMAMTSDEKTLLIGSQFGVECIDWPLMTKVNRLEIDMEHVLDLSYSPDGSRLLVAGGSPGEMGVVEVFEWPSQRRLIRRVMNSDVVYRAAWSDDGKHLAVACADTVCSVLTRTSFVS